MISPCEPKRIITRVLDNTKRLQTGQRERGGLEINNAEIVSKVGEDERERKSWRIKKEGGDKVNVRGEREHEKERRGRE